MAGHKFNCDLSSTPRAVDIESVSRVLQGIPDPAAWREAVRGVVEALKNEVSHCSFCGGTGTMTHYSHATVSGLKQVVGTGQCGACAKSRAALARLAAMEQQKEKANG